MGFSKYDTAEKKELRSQIMDIGQAMNRHRRKYLDLDIKRNALLNKLADLGINYGERKKKRGKQ